MNVYSSLKGETQPHFLKSGCSCEPMAANYVFSEYYSERQGLEKVKPKLITPSSEH